MVCRVESRSVSQGMDGLWCEVTSRSVASSKVKFVTSRSSADLLICYVTLRSVAGWTREHPLKGKL
ncbi:DUF6150 family protein [Enterobacter hormaechei]|uniref:DUF6150 family protein n=1 Tax=Enterobacter hormaechei TaxID=158836 RepID=UPI003C6CAD55